MTTPADIIATWLNGTLHHDWTRRIAATSLIADLDAAGYDIVARQPDTCPTCGSRRPEHLPYVTRAGRRHYCPDPWHGEGR